MFDVSNASTSANASIEKWGKVMVDNKTEENTSPGHLLDDLAYLFCARCGEYFPRDYTQ
jgi:hypothetical protein